MNFDAIKQAAQNYQADMTRFLRDMIAIPSESCEEEGVVRRIAQEMEKLGYDNIGHIVVNGASQKHDAIVEQARINVVRALAAAGLLHDHRDEVHRNIVFHVRSLKNSRGKSVTPPFPLPLSLRQIFWRQTFSPRGFLPRPLF